VTGQDPLQFDADPLEAAFRQLDGPIHLPSLSVRERQGVLPGLRDWVTLLVRRFAIEPRVVPPCWEQHNGMVEALLALRDHERACYAESACPTAAVEWLRALRDVEILLTERLAQTQCTAHEHRQTPVHAWTAEPTAGAVRSTPEGCTNAPTRSSQGMEPKK
jgi:hypothetical protein